MTNEITMAALAGEYDTMLASRECNGGVVRLIARLSITDGSWGRSFLITRTGQPELECSGLAAAIRRFNELVGEPLSTPPTTPQPNSTRGGEIR